MPEHQPSANLTDAILALANREADRPAVVQGSRSLSFSDLMAQSAKLARALRSRGVGAGGQVGIALRDGIDNTTALFALWMLDAVALPIDFRARAEERGRLAEEFDLAFIIEDRDLGAGAYPTIVWNADFAELVARQPGTPPIEHRSGAHPATISLTSGTTGRPAGVVLGHAELFERCRSGLMLRRPQGASLGGRFLNAYPLSFSASRHHTLRQLLQGATVLFHPPTFGAHELAERVRRENVTFLFAVPATVSAMLDAVGEGDRPFLPTLETLYCGGSGMSAADKIRAYRRLTPGFLHCFSASLSGTVSILEGEDLLARPDTEGRILPSVSVEIVDDADRPVPTGEVGILRVRSVGMASQLYRGRDRVAGDRIRDDWAYTGDLARLSADGFLTVVGRTSDLIIRGGANVHPGEVEAAIARRAGVRDVAVVGYPDPVLGEEIAAFVVTDGSIGEPELAAHCRIELQPDKRPRRFVLVDALPRNANGKVLRTDLRTRLSP
ncbi:class I adenylate-forming enzyme family protein [Aquibium microcysteis]|uniref:class I adenylate-forming enzyme family protein n=1 Tax=Aquibium microcysteis TaxID=675281 RepID=UPI00165CF5B7|nr:AMP-binding protein [Aquibium microcysteis]